MGGYDTFLHPNVDPEKIQGIVLNPMQQSSQAKLQFLVMPAIHGIFGNLKKKLINAGMIHLNMLIIIIQLKLKLQMHYVNFLNI